MVFSSICFLYLFAQPQRLQTDEEMEAYLERLKESLSSVEGVLYRTAVPNLKALEKMEEVKDKLQGMAEGIFCSAYSVDYYR